MIKFILFLILVLTTLNSKILDISNSNIQTLEYTYFINDNKNLYNYEDIYKNENLETLKIKHIGSAKGPFWTKITLQNNSNEIKQFIMFNPLAGTNKIDVYLVQNDKLIKTFNLGDFRPQKQVQNLATYSNINLILKPNETITVISKIENFHIYNLGWEIVPSLDFFKQETQKLFYSGLLGGIVLLFCIYNIFNFLIYKNSIYLIISSIAVALSFYQYGFHGIFYFLDIGLNLELITAITWNSSIIGGFLILLFAYVFFNQKEKYVKSSYINIFFLFCYFFLFLLIIYSQFFNEEYFKYSFLLSFIVLTSTVYLFLFAIYMVWKKEIGSLYYLLGEGVLLISIFFNTIGLFNIIAYDESMKFLITFSYIINLSFLVRALYVKNKMEQEELKRTKILLLEQSRFNSIGQAIGHASHQWKSPLTSIGTSLTLLETVYYHNIEKLNLTFEKQLPTMKRSLELMKKSIDEFSNFYKTKNKKEEFSLIDSISNVSEILSQKITLKNVEIKYELEKNFSIYSFEHIFSNIFLVLIDNSLDAFTKNQDNLITISAIKKNKKIIITYKDNAGGIKIKPIESVFEYFVSSKKNKKLSGIGLAVVKMLINDRLKGEISVKNDDFGVVFTIII